MTLSAAILIWSLLAAPVDLAPNPSFELADAGTVAFWEARTPSGPTHTMAWVDDIAHTGRRSLCITGRDPQFLARWRVGQLRNVAFQPGSTVILSAMVKAAGVVDHAQLRLYFLDAKGGVMTQPASGPLAGDQDWTRIEVQATVPDGAAYAMAYLELFGAGTAWFDEVSWRGEAIPPPGLPEPQVLPAAEAWEITGYETATRQNRAMLQLPEGLPQGEALFYAPGPAAGYEVEVVHLDEPDGAGTLELVVDGRSVASHTLDAQPGSETASVTWRVSNVPLQTNSRIKVIGMAEGGERARLLELRLRAASPFQGELRELAAPPSLKVCAAPELAAQARRQLPAAMEAAAAKLNEAREARLATFQTPDDWAGELRRIRSELDQYFGPFPERTPLNPKSYGRIERPEFTIEKITIESRPGFLVSTNLYLPARREGKVPGVLFCCGHSDEGKGYHLYHETCLGLVLKGYAVLAIDPMGQGERKEFFTPDGKPIGPVPQHHQLGRPLFLAGQTLAGMRVWDGLRAVDYLASRPEVDAERLGVVGNSGGGQESLLMAAVDERLKVCAAAHPGGPMENTWLNGQSFRDHEILSLIAPRACRFIVGEKSGEEWHVPRMEDMQRFYNGLGAPDKLDFAWVDGVHNMERPKREPAYGWLNQWFAMPGDQVEPPLVPFTAEELWCSPNGSTIQDLGSRTGLSIAEEDVDWPKRARPADPAAARAKLQAEVERVLRLGDAAPEAVNVSQAGSLAGDGFEARLLKIEAADRWLPAALLLPAETTTRPVVLHVSEDGKPTRADRPSLPIDLCKAGYPVLSVDVRGVGELDPQQGKRNATALGYDASQWRRDSVAINIWGYAGATLTAWQTADVRLAVDALGELGETNGKPIIGLGEGKGQVWMLLAASRRPQVSRVLGLRSLCSFRTLFASPVQEVTEYCWMPGAPDVFDLGELPALVAPRRVDVLAPIDADGGPSKDVDAAFSWAKQLGAVVRIDASDDVARCLAN